MKKNNFKRFINIILVVCIMIACFGSNNSNVNAASIQNSDLHDEELRFTQNDYIKFGNVMYDENDLLVKLDSIQLGVVDNHEYGRNFDAIKVNISVSSKRDSIVQFDLKGLAFNDFIIDIEDYEDERMNILYNYTVDRITKGDSVILSYIISGEGYKQSQLDNMFNYFKLNDDNWTKLSLGYNIIDVDGKNDEDVVSSFNLNYDLNGYIDKYVTDDNVELYKNKNYMSNCIFSNDMYEVYYLNLEYDYIGSYYLNLLINCKCDIGNEVVICDAKVNGKSFEHLSKTRIGYFYDELVDTHVKKNFIGSGYITCKMCIYQQPGVMAGIYENLDSISFRFVDTYMGLTNEEVKIKSE